VSFEVMFEDFNDGKTLMAVGTLYMVPDFADQQRAKSVFMECNHQRLNDTMQYI